MNKASTVKANPFGLLFSPFGRISRLTFCWVAIPIVVMIILLSPNMPYWPQMPKHASASDFVHSTRIKVVLITGFVRMVLHWILFAVCAKRLHDFGLSAFCGISILLPLFYAVFNTFMPIFALPLGLTDIEAYETLFRYANVITFYGRWVSLGLVLILCVVPGSKKANSHGPSLAA